MKTMQMTRRGDWRYLTPDDVAAARRAMRWHGVALALWVLVAAVALWVLVCACWPEAGQWFKQWGMWSAECGVIPNSEFDIPHLMFGAVVPVPEPLWPVVVVCGGLTLLVWAAAQRARWVESRREPILGEAYEDEETWRQGDKETGREEDLEIRRQGDWEAWRLELERFFAARGALIADWQARHMRALCVPNHAQALVMLDSFLRREFKMRLFMTSLMEIQAICAKAVRGDEAQAGKPMLREGGAA